MPLNLPPVLPQSNNSASSLPKNLGSLGKQLNVGRAQDFSVTQLQQRVDRQNARVSMNQVVASRNNANGQGSTTSINRIGSGGNTAQTSILYDRNARTSINAPEKTQDSSSEQADESRYAYIQRLVRARKAKERALESQKSQSGPSAPFSLGTGSAHRHTGASGFHKQIGRYFRSHRQQFSHLKKEQKAVPETTVEERLTHKRTGAEITRYDRLAMKKNINKAKQPGIINLRTAKQFKKIVTKLDN